LSQECLNGRIKLDVVTLYSTILNGAIPIAFSIDMLIIAEFARLRGCVELLEGIRASSAGAVGIVPHPCRWLKAERIHL
jgi:hypothetical protein